MTFVLPEIEKVNCQSFTACGRVGTTDKTLSKLFPGKQPLVALTKQGRSQRFVRLCFEEGGYLHLDVATRAFFPVRWKPKPTRTWPQIQVPLGRFIGQKVQVRAEAVFGLPFDRLPESSLIRAMSVESKTPKVSMKLTSGTLSVGGAAIQRITWSLENEGNEIEVRLRSTLKVKVNAMYLVDLFKVLNDSFQVLVLGNEKKPNQS